MTSWFFCVIMHIFGSYKVIFGVKWCQTEVKSKGFQKNQNHSLHFRCIIVKLSQKKSVTCVCLFLGRRHWCNDHLMPSAQQYWWYVITCPLLWATARLKSIDSMPKQFLKLRLIWILNYRNFYGSLTYIWRVKLPGIKPSSPKPSSAMPFFSEQKWKSF